MSDKTRYRFWLELLNLSWGSYILHDGERDRSWYRKAEAWFLGSRGVPSRFGNEVRWLIRTVLSDIVMMSAALLLNVGFHYFWRDSVEQCRFGKYLILLALAVLALAVALSFFGFLRCLDCLSYAQGLRQLHQATGFFFLGDRPPSLLYVTDGGIQDCTSVVQLLRRGARHILLVLAAHDPEDDLEVLRTMMRIAMAEQLCCFYDLADPTRCADILLGEYRARKDWKYLELGIRYGWSYGAAAVDAREGRLVVIKNRLPPSFRGTRCRPLLTEEELLCESAGEGSGCAETLGCEGVDLLEEELGGFGCCDNCHAWGLNCGRKFPHLSFSGYLWLTPTLFSSLCRLGNAISKDGVDCLARRMSE